MKIIIMMDSFKESLDAASASQAVEKGILQAMPDADTRILAMADGGEGTLQALLASSRHQLIQAETVDALHRLKQASYGILEDGTAVMDMASACGLSDETRKHPLQADTRGLGKMIKDAMDHGCKEFIIGIGGSASSDGGTGMLKELGMQFLDQNGQPVSDGNIGLAGIERIEADLLDANVKGCKFTIACDVDNPLTGKNGAVYIYGPQKGIQPDQLAEADERMKSYARTADSFSGKDNADVPGAGAAGGLGFGFLNFLNGRLVSGADLIMERSGLSEALKDADLIISGEGSIDNQSFMGKGVGQIVAQANSHHVPVILFAGRVAADIDVLQAHGAGASFCIQQSAASLQEAMNPQTAKKNLEKTAFEVFTLIHELT